MITCPNCNTQMTEVSVPEHYGSREIILEQCEKCGGLWFDKDEFYRVKVGHAQDVEKLDINKLSNFTQISTDALICPKDGHSLKEYIDPYFFKDMHILSCNKCRGFWFNRGEFTKYQAKKTEGLKKENSVSNLAQAVLQLQNYKDDMKRQQKLQAFIRPSLLNALPIRSVKTNDWRLDILLDIIAAIFKRILI